MKNLSLVAILAFVCMVPFPNKINSISYRHYAQVETRGRGSVEGIAAPGLAHIKFSAQVDEASVNAALAALAKAKELKVKQVVLELNTPGGSVSDGFRLVKAIEELGMPVHCIVDGEAYSMGFYILQSCTTRSMTKRSALMAHEPSVGGEMYGNQHFYRELAQSLAAVSAAMSAHEAKHLCIGLDDLVDNIKNKSWWMDSQTAYAIGAVDFLVDTVDQLTNPLIKTGFLPQNLISQQGQGALCLSRH
jgi:ATP-dependent protease ClpP protease subunit